MTKPNKQELIYAFIKEEYEKNGYSPSISEIAAHMGLTAKSNIHRQLQALVGEGRLSNLGGRYVPADVKNEGEREVTMVPVIGKVAAGLPITAFEEPQGYVAYLPQLGDSRDLFGLTIKGDSMVGAGIFDGDVVIVEKTPDVVNGDIAVALVGDDATVKTFYREKDHIRLQPENPDYEPIIVKDIKILGKVVASLRYLTNRGTFGVHR